MIYFIGQSIDLDGNRSNGRAGYWVDRGNRFAWAANTITILVIDMAFCQFSQKKKVMAWPLVQGMMFGHYVA